MNWNLTNPRVMLAAAAIVIGLAGFAHYQVISSQKADMENAQQQFRAAQAANVTLAKALQQREELRAEVANFAAEVPPDTTFAPLRESLADVLNRQSVLERDVSTGTTIAGRYVDRTPVVVRFRGPFDALVAVLEEIDSSGRLSRIDRLAARKTGGGPSGSLSVEINFTVFSGSPDEVAGWISEASN